MLLFLVVPLVALMLRVSLDDLVRLVFTTVTGQDHSDAAQVLTLSLTTTLLATGVTLVVGTPLAYLIARRRFWGRDVLDALVDLPLVLPPAVAGLALFVALGRSGLLGPTLGRLGIALPFTTAAVVLAQTFVASPFYIRAAISAFREIRREVEDAAAVDGASGWGVFARVTLPLASPALASGAVMTWARALGEFGATSIFAGSLVGRTETVPLLIYLEFDDGVRGLQEALTLSVVLLLIAFAVLLTVRGLLRRALPRDE